MPVVWTCKTVFPLHLWTEVPEKQHRWVILTHKDRSNEDLKAFHRRRITTCVGSGIFPQKAMRIKGDETHSSSSESNSMMIKSVTSGM